jgi:hypothetical protein
MTAMIALDTSDEACAKREDEERHQRAARHTALLAELEWACRRPGESPLSYRETVDRALAAVRAERDGEQLNDE